MCDIGAYDANVATLFIITVVVEDAAVVERELTDDGTCTTALSPLEKKRLTPCITEGTQ